MNEKHYYIAAGIAGIVLFAWGWWKSRHGKWFHWGDPFALLILAGWLLVCFGYVRWELGFVGRVTDHCGNPIAYAYVVPDAMEVDKYPKKYNSPLPKGWLQTDVDGNFQVMGKFSWNKPFKDAPIAFSTLEKVKVGMPKVCASRVVETVEEKFFSVKVVALPYLACRCKCKSFYPREKEGLSEDEKKELVSALSKFHRAKMRSEEDGSGRFDPRLCEFMAVWTRLLSQVGPDALCDFSKEMKYRKDLRNTTAYLMCME